MVYLLIADFYGSFRQIGTRQLASNRITNGSKGGKGVSRNLPATAPNTHWGNNEKLAMTMNGQFCDVPGSDEVLLAD